MVDEIWIVTYWGFTGVKVEPTITVFDNEEAAKKCYNYFKDIYLGCVLDKSMLYKKFEVSE